MGYFDDSHYEGTHGGKLEDSYFDQEMEAEARDTRMDEYEHSFTVVGKCLSCLQTTKISPHHLCESCDDMNESTEGTLLSLLKN